MLKRSFSESESRLLADDPMDRLPRELEQSQFVKFPWTIPSNQLQVISSKRNRGWSLRLSPSNQLQDQVLINQLGRCFSSFFLPRTLRQNRRESCSGLVLQWNFDSFAGGEEKQDSSEEPFLAVMKWMEERILAV